MDSICCKDKGPNDISDYDRHTCTRTFKNMRCSSKWLGKTLVSELSEHPNMTSSAIVKGAHEKYVVHISRSKTHRAKVCAQDMIIGDQVAHFTNI